MAGIEHLVEELEHSYGEAQERMSDPAVYNDHKQAAEAGRRLKELEGPYKRAQEWRQVQADLADARSDPELASMAAESEQELERLEQALSGPAT
jgi:peptide chain release factor 1